jgi:hypothetical protein
VRNLLICALSAEKRSDIQTASKRHFSGIPSNAMWIDIAFKKQLLSERALNIYSKYLVK